MPLFASPCSAPLGLGSRFLRLAIPVSLQSMVGALYGVVDMYMVGHLGDTAVAAVGLASSFVSVLFLVLVALGSGVSVLVAQYYGKGDEAGLRMVTAQGVVLSVVCCLPMVGLFMVFGADIMQLISPDPSLVRLADPFLTLVSLSILFPAITIPLESGLRAIGYATFPALIGMACIPLNALANYVFIFGWAGIPAMGVLGSALGTLLIRVLYMVVFIGFCYHKRFAVVFYWIDLKAALTRVRMSRFVRISIPLLLHDVLWAIGMVLYNVIFARTGTAELAAFSQLAVMESVLICCFVGFSVACSALLGQSLGRGDLPLALREARFMLGASAWLSLGLGGLLFLLCRPLALVSTQLSGIALEYYLYGLQVLGLSLWLRILNMVGIVGILRSGADTAATILIDMVGMWLVGLPLALISVAWLGLSFYWLYLIPVVQEIIKLLLTLYRIRQRRWLRNLVSLPVSS